MVLSGLSVVSDVGFKIGAEHLDMPWKYSTSSDEWRHRGILISKICSAACQCFYHLSW